MGMRAEVAGPLHKSHHVAPSPEEVRDLELMATGVKLVKHESLEGWGQSCCRVTKLTWSIKNELESRLALYEGVLFEYLWQDYAPLLCPQQKTGHLDQTTYQVLLPQLFQCIITRYHQLCILVTAQQCSTVPQWYFIAMMNSSVMLVFEQPLSFAPCLQGGCVRWVRVDLSADKFFFVYGQ